MGNRAFVVFENKESTEFSPAAYLHWNGGPESIYAFLDELDRLECRADQECEAARFVQIVGNFFGLQKGDLFSLGLKMFDPKNVGQLGDWCDNGVYLVCRNEKNPENRRMRRFLCKYNVKTNKFGDPEEMSEVEVKNERDAAYKDEKYAAILEKLKQLQEDVEFCRNYKDDLEEADAAK